MTGTLILVVASAIFFTLTDQVRDQATPTPPPAPDSAEPGEPLVGAATPEAAVEDLLDAWRLGSRGMAERVASDEAVDRILAAPFPRGARVLGCGTARSGELQCVVDAGERMLLLSMERSSEGMTYVRFAEWVSRGPSFHLG